MPRQELRVVCDKKRTSEEAGSSLEEPENVEDSEPANILDPTCLFADVFGGERFIGYVRIRFKPPWRVLI